MTFKKGYKINSYTDDLQYNLAHCIGKNTVEIYEDTRTDKLIGLYHFGSLIAVYNENINAMFYNFKYYDYSNSTGRVRNAFSRYMMGFAPKLYDLRSIENKEEYITYDTIFGRYDIFVVNIDE